MANDCKSGQRFSQRRGVRVAVILFGARLQKKDSESQPVFDLLSLRFLIQKC